MILELFNYIFFFCYNLISVNKDYCLIFGSLFSKIWFDSLPKLSIIGDYRPIEIIVENLFRFSQKVNTKISLSFTGKEISSTIIFPISIKKASPSQNCFSEMFGYT